MIHWDFYNKSLTTEKLHHKYTHNWRDHVFVFWSTAFEHPINKLDPLLFLGTRFIKVIIEFPKAKYTVILFSTLAGWGAQRLLLQSGNKNFSLFADICCVLFLFHYLLPFLSHSCFCFLSTSASANFLFLKIAFSSSRFSVFFHLSFLQYFFSTRSSFRHS